MLTFLLWFVATPATLFVALAVWDAVRRAGIDSEIRQRLRGGRRCGPPRPPGLARPAPPRP